MFFSLIAVDCGNVPARFHFFTVSRARRAATFWICASLGLRCFIFFLCVLQTAAASAQSLPDRALEGASPTSSAAPAQTNSASDVSKNIVKPSESLTPDPALAPARSFLHEGKLSEAESATRDHLRTHADSADAHFLLGFILFRQVQAKWLEAGKGQSESLLYSGDASGSVAQFRDAKAKESLAEFTAGAKYHVPNAFDLKIVALDYILLKDNTDADHWLTRSLQADPRDPQAWYYLGRTKYSEGQFPQAIEAFKQCLKLEPRNIQAENNMGLSYEALGQRDQAIQAFEDAIAWETETAVRDPEPFFELAHLYMEQNQPEKALPHLSQSVAISPNLCKAREALGKAYSLLHRFPEAQAELEKAVALEPATASLHYLLGQVYRQEGMVSKAQAEFDRYDALQQAQSQLSSRPKS